MKGKKTILDRAWHRLISVLLQLISHVLCALRITRPKVIYMMDGGICSQMVQYLCGRYYMDAGINVFFDLRFFVEKGKDRDGRFERKFELTEMFPSLPFSSLTMRQSIFYHRWFSYGHNGSVLPKPHLIKRTTCFNGYYSLPKTVDFKEMISNNFNLKTMCEIPTHIPQNDNGINCAVHVRRGDLANRNLGGYEMVSDAYFFSAINDVTEKHGNVHFYFFSDEPEYVLNNICPQVKEPYDLMRGNKAYVDLALIAECDVVIASQGSFGTMAARLNGKSDLYIPAPDSELGFEIKNFSKEVF